MKLSTALGAIVFAASAVPSTAIAASIYSGTVTGIFSAPVLSGNVINTDGSLLAVDNTATAVYDASGPSTVVWGANAGSSSLIFSGATFTGVAPGDLFELGTLRYFNGTSAIDTLIFGTDFTLTVDVGPGTIVDPVVSAISIVTTINTGISAARDSDLVGFSTLGDTTFNVFEGAEASAILYGRIIGDPMLSFDLISLGPNFDGSPDIRGFIGSGIGGAPEPGSIFLSVTGLGLLAFVRRRSQFQ
jgi:hypothetical protein